MKILIIGAGMYVCGRGTNGYGTVLPSLYQAKKDYGFIEKVTVCATSSKSIAEFLSKKRELDEKFDMSLSVECLPKQGKNEKSYAEAFSDSEIDFDCAIIVVPDHLHFEVTEATLKAGIHTLVVKPFVTKFSDAIRLIELADDKALYGSVEFHKRYDYANIKLRDDIKKGVLGDLLYIHVEYSQRKCIPEVMFSRWAEHTNVFQYLGVHYVDLIYFLTEALPCRVMALGQKKWLLEKGIDTYDAIEVFIEWEMSGVCFVSTHLTNWIDPTSTSAMSDQKIKVIGTKGRFESDQKNRGIQIVTDQDGIEDFNPYFSQFYSSENASLDVYRGYGYEGLSGFLRDVHLIKLGKQKKGELERFRPTFRSSLVSTSLLEAANRSLASDNSWIRIDKADLEKYLNTR